MELTISTRIRLKFFGRLLRYKQKFYSRFFFFFGGGGGGCNSVFHIDKHQLLIVVKYRPSFFVKAVLNILTEHTDAC